MPKSRKKRAKHQDFQKVKLKVGRKLPRSANETVATFQSKGIQIREQFSSAESSQPTTKRNVSLKELLSQLQHYSSSTRHDALAGLREIISSNPLIIRTHLSSVIERLSDLFVDKDAAVRSSVQKLLKTIFPAVDETQISPFFPMLSAQLCCAMTHIFQDIQSDSLPILDACLDHYPILVTKYSNRIMSNFLEQISKQSSKLGGGSSKERTLITNPHSRLTNQKWRLQVLTRVEKFLTAMIKKGYNSSTGHGEQLYMDMDDKGAPLNSPYIHKPGDINNVLVLGTDAVQHRHSHFSLNDLSQQTSSADTPLNQMKTNIQTLVPLLIDCWVEAGPAQMTSDLPGNTLSSEAVSLLQCVVGILQLMVDYLQHAGHDRNQNNLEWFVHQYRKELTHQLFTGFPYSMHSNSQAEKKKRGKTTAQTVSILSLNLSITHIMSCLLMHDSAPVTQKVNSQPITEKIIKFMTSIFSGPKLSLEQMSESLKISRTVIKCCQDDDDLVDLLAAVYSVWNVRQPLSHHNVHLNHFLAWLVLDCPNQHIIKQSAVQKWLSSLPHHFLSVISARREKKASSGGNLPVLEVTLLKVIQRSASRGHTALINSLQDNFLSMLDGDVIETLSPHQRRQLMELLMVLPTATEEHHRALVTQWRSGAAEADIMCYVIEILQHKFSLNMSSDLDLSLTTLHLRFLISLAFNFTSPNAAEVSAEDAAYFEKSYEKWQGHLKVIKKVCSALSHCGNPDQLLHLILTSFMTSKENSAVMSVSCLYSLLYLTKMLSIKQLDAAQLVTIATSMMKLLDIAVSFKSKTADSSDSAQFHEVHKDILVICCDCWNHVPGLASSYLLQLQQLIKSCGDVDAVSRSLASLVTLLKHPDFHQAVVATEKHLLQDLLVTAKTVAPAVEDTTVYQSVSYEISLMK